MYVDVAVLPLAAAYSFSVIVLIKPFFRTWTRVKLIGYLNRFQRVERWQDLRLIALLG